MLSTTSAFSWAALTWLSLTRPATALASYETIVSDVCIIGGGSSGTYSAIRLQQMGKKVSLIEKEGRLGGHANVYHVPGTDDAFNYGVVVFENTTIVTDYFRHLDVPLVKVDYSSGRSTEYANFANGSIVSPSVFPSVVDTGAALLAYQQQLAKYPYLASGFNLPSPVPKDLLLPWGDFLHNYNLGAMAYEVWLYTQGVANSLALPTLYMMKLLNAQLTSSLISGGLLTTAHDNTQELYDKALVELGPSAHISSNITHIVRNHDCVEVHVSTPTGEKLIKASKLIIAIEPKVSNLRFLDLSRQEQSTFGQFNNSYYWNAVIKGSGLPDNASIDNVDPAAPWNIPALPGLYNVGGSGYSGLHIAYYSSPSYLSDDAVKADILATVARLVESLGLPPVKASPEFVGFNCHCP